MSPRPIGRCAFVTGASRGIGRAVAVALTRDGHRVGFCWSRDAEGAAATLAEIEAAGGTGRSVRAAVEDPAQVDAAFAAIEADLGPVELLVNNAGITRDGLVHRLSDADWRDVLAVDLDGAFHTIRRAAPAMAAAGFGRIVNISSVGGHLGGPGQANYSAAKAGLVGLSRSVARELGPRGVTCNVVAPGPVVTAMTERMGAEWAARVAEAVPLRRLGTPEECAAVVAFLCRPEAGYITGAVIPVDGGLGMGA